MGTSAQQIAGKDPVLLGVSVPLGVTRSAAKEVGNAWRDFGLNLLQAIKQQREAIGKSGKSASAKSDASDTRDGNASSSTSASA
jgi:hypothetical protein